MINLNNSYSSYSKKSISASKVSFGFDKITEKEMAESIKEIFVDACFPSKDAAQNNMKALAKILAPHPKYNELANAIQKLTDEKPFRTYHSFLRD